MKLGKVTHNDPMKRLSIGVHSSTVDLLEQYRSFYKTATGDDISLAQLIEEMTKKFMAADADFKRFRTGK
jgi:hypothetical protein